MNENPSRTAAIQRVTLVGAAVNVALAAAKIVLGLLGNSWALVVDGIHSLSDLATDVLVVVVAHYGGQSADEDHPYGHQRYETAAAVALGTLLALTGIGILWDTIDRLFDTQRLLHPGGIALLGALASVVAKEALYHYTQRVAKSVKSQLLLANAWHHRSDAVSSIVVLIGIGGAMAGLDYLDAIAAVVVALMIVHIGWRLGWNAIRELVDTGLEEHRVEAIHQQILSVPGVHSLHLLRTRRMGEDALVDVHIQLRNPRASVSEGHQISEAVRSRLLEQVDEVRDVTVHIDPENDAIAPSCASLPLREELLPELQRRWRDIPEAQLIHETTLHYLGARVLVELRLPLDQYRDQAGTTALTLRFNDALSDLEAVDEVQLLFAAGQPGKS